MMNKFKKFGIFLVIFGLLTLYKIAFANDTQFCGIGVEIVKDGYTKRTVITKVLPNSPAQKANLPIGGEILEIDGVKTKPYTFNQIADMVKGVEGTKVNILIKHDGKKVNYEITRRMITNQELQKAQKYNPNRPEWKDICPYGMEYVAPDNNFHLPGTKKALYAEDANYWYQRKQNFEKELSFCDSVNQNAKNVCYEKLRNREQQINSTYVSAQERYAQRQMQWSQIGNALQQQNYQQQQLKLQRQNMIMQNMPKWSDVAPKQYNVNVRGTMYHYYP